MPAALLMLLTLALACASSCTETVPKALPDATDTAQVLPPRSTSGTGHRVAVAEAKPLAEAQKAPAPSPLVADVPEAALLANRIVGWFEDHEGRRSYVQVDKPLYRPGETIWFRVWDLKSSTLSADPHADVVVQLVSPRGAVVVEKRLKAGGGLTNDFELPADAAGGEYKLVANALGQKVERPVIVATYEPPRLRMKLEFVRRAYGPGDRVEATLNVEPATGGAYANREVNALVRLDGVDLPRVKATTNDKGATVVSFALPDDIDGVGDGILTILCEDGGVTESISRRIPIMLRKVQLAFFPEGGELVSGLENRVYFEARTPLDKVADVEGRIVDDLGNAVATFETYHLGLGRMSFLPASGRKYFAQVTKPVGVTERFALPIASNDGCVLRTYDDPDGTERAIRVAVECSEKRTVVLAATLREQPFDTAAVAVEPGTASVVWLSPKTDEMASAQGVARVTLFDEEMNPMAERVVFRNRRGGLQVQVTPDKERYGPRDSVSLAIVTKDATGKPVSAEVAVSVVDDTVLSYADDKTTANMLARVLLESDLPGKIEEPNVFFDPKEKKGAFSMELLMGTRGYRRFEWRPVLQVEPDANKRAELRALDRERVATGRGIGGFGLAGANGGRGLGRAMAKGAVRLEERQQMPFPAAAPPPRADAPMPVLQMDAEPMPAPAPPRREMKKEIARNDMGMAMDKAWRAEKPMAFDYAPVRVFRAPEYAKNDIYTGPRSDFRDTLFWAPSVKTDAAGKATVTFPTSDALTSFRILTEGAGGGFVGRKETTFESSLPFGLFAKLPQEVSQGDRILLPVTLSNERNNGLDVKLVSTIGASLVPASVPETGGFLAGGSKRSLFHPLDVKGLASAEVRLQASTGTLSDELVRTVRVTPPGFPQMWEASGKVKSKVTHEIDLTGTLPDAVDAKLTLYASSLSTLVGGVEGMLRKPSGCFEQTSSTNYPNVMVLRYLREHDVNDAELLTRATKLIDDGYQRLSGFESANKGYEWFGGDPGHEALTAYGLVQFTDMQEVWGSVDPAMVVRTQRWLLSRRDGKGGFQQNPRALDSFGRASPEVTNAYITWALAKTATPGLDAELVVQRKLAKESKDAYLMGLATGTLLSIKAERKDGLVAAKRLAAMQESDGAFRKADHSITRSGGTNLHVETTSLAVLALLDAGGFDGEVRRSIDWLQNNRSGFGEWGATQATVLALEAMTAYAKDSRKMSGSGTVSVRVNGKLVETQAYESGRREPLTFASVGKALTAGKNVIEIENVGSAELPYSIAVESRALAPATSANVAVSLDTTLARNSMAMAETVRLNVKVKNVTDKGLPLTVARVGIPGGLNSQTWQLKELREKGVIAFFETRPREVTLYFRDFQPGEEKQVAIELVAEVPGTYTAPASSAYLYYTDDLKFWAPPVKVDVTPT